MCLLLGEVLLYSRKIMLSLCNHKHCYKHLSPVKMTVDLNCESKWMSSWNCKCDIYMQHWSSSNPRVTPSRKKVSIVHISFWHRQQKKSVSLFCLRFIHILKLSHSDSYKSSGLFTLLYRRKYLTKALIQNIRKHYWPQMLIYTWSLLFWQTAKKEREDGWDVMHM